MSAYRTSDDPRPPAPSERASREGELGPLLSVHRPRRGRAGLALALAMTFAVMVTSAGMRASGPEIATLLVVALVVGLAGAAATIAVRKLEPELALHRGGVVLRRRWTEPATMLFDDVDAVYYDAEVATAMFGFVRYTATLKLTLVAHDGRRLAVPRGLARTEDVVRAVDVHVVRPLLPLAVRAFGDGEPLTFGPVILDADGVRVRGDAIAWGDLERVQAEPHELVFRRERVVGFHPSVRAAQVPHARLLVTLLATRVPVEGSTGFWQV